MLHWEGRVAETVSYAFRSEPAGEYMPGVPRFLPVPDGLRWYGKRDDIEPPDELPPPAPVAFYAEHDDGTVTVGKWRVPKTVRGRVIIAASTYSEEKCKQRARVWCPCGLTSDLTLAAWRYADTHAADGCRACRLRRGSTTHRAMFEESRRDRARALASTPR